jgi:two-component system cell cycle sensor histidine kinase/response regulator CckA
MKMPEETGKMASVVLDVLSEYVLFLDPQMRVQWANRAAAESAGPDLPDLSGRRCFEIWHNRKEPCPECPVIKVFETGRPQRGEITSPEKRHWSIRGYPVRDGQGRILGAAEIAVDITALRQAQEALEESEAKYTTLVEQANDAIVIVQDGVGKFFNKAARGMFGYSSEELTGMPFQKLLADESREEVETRYKTRLSGDTPPSFYEARAVHQDGSKLDFELSTATIQYEGRPAVMGIARDITNRKKSEQALRESEERFRALSAGAFDCVVIHEKGIILEVNDTFNRIFGFDPGEVIGKPILDFAAPESRETVKNNILSGYDKPYPAIGLRKDGTKVHGELLGKNVRYKDRQARVTAIRDLTEHKKIEDALRESEERYRSLIETSPDAITMTDLEGHLIAANQESIRMSGCDSLEELLTSSADAFARVHPQDRELAIENAKRTLEEGTVRNVEYRLLKKDGSHFPVELSASTILDAEGKPKAFVSIVRDITERKQVEEALRSSEEFSSTLLNSAPNGIIVINPDTSIQYVNRALEKLTGYSAEEIVGRKAPYPWWPEEVRGEITRDLENSMRIGVVRLEKIFKKKTGEEFWVEISSGRVERDGKLSYLISNWVDITARKRAEQDRKKLEEQIQHAQKLESLGILAGGIAHDFNNLLMGVLGNASLALLDLPAGSPVRHSVEQIEKTARAAADLTNQMLAYSGKGRFVVEPVDLSRLVKEMAGLLKVSISKKVDLKFDFDRDLPPVEADATQLRQVIMNLIINASEAIGETSGVVSVRTGTTEADRSFFSETYTRDNLPEGTYVYLEVSDTGCGMDEETVGRIFDPFFTSKFTGRGLGLAAVLGIVRGHKGAIRVQSEPGQGTTIRAIFPPCATEGRAAAPEPWSDKVPKASGKVLVVDDEATIRDVSRRMLESSGFEVVTAGDGLEAAEIFRTQGNEIAAVLLDATMPRMGGLETFEELRRIRKDVRVILSSGYNQQEATERFTGKGLAGFIQKPYRFDQLVDKMNEVLGK